ncbi:hypothetical protein Tco_1185510 [Tanacetum coccineum]
MQEVILLYKGLEVPTRQILDSKGDIPTMITPNAKITIQELAKHSKKWHDGMSTRTRSTETSDGLAAIQAQLNNLGREIKKVNEKVYATQVDAAIKNQGASIKALEIQIGQLSKVLQEKGSGNLPSSTEINPRDHVKLILTIVEVDTTLISRNRNPSEYAVSDPQKKEGSYRLKDLDAYSIGTTLLDNALPNKEKGLWSFTLPCIIDNMCFNKALADLRASVSVMPFSTYTKLGLGELAPTKLIFLLGSTNCREDAYDSDVDEGPMLLSLSWPTCHPLVQPTVKSMRNCSSEQIIGVPANERASLTL